jgi:septal ring factor EnvC (AmiA/AmiB activator)
LTRQPRLAAAFFLLGALAGVLAPAAAAQPAGQDANEELARIVSELNDLDSWLNIADGKRIKLQQSLRNIDRQIAQAGASIAAAARGIAAAEAKLAALEARKGVLTAQRDAQAQEIAEHLAAAQRLRGSDLFKQLLNQEDPAELERMLRYHEYFSRARIDAVDQFRATVIELDSNAQTAREEQARLTRQRETLAAERTARQGARTQQQQLIASLEAESATKKQDRERLRANRERLENLLAELTRRSTELDGTGFANSKGKLPMPLSAKIAKAYGSKRSDGELAWKGVLFDAPVGSAVQAVYRGRVVFADWLRGYGLLLILDHGGEYMTLYGHADTLAKQVGDWAESGETIATAGRSGGQEDPGLYFEVRHKSKTHDPVNWLRR